MGEISQLVNVTTTALQHIFTGVLLWLVGGLALALLGPLLATALDSLGLQIRPHHMQAAGWFLKGLFTGALLLYVFHAYAHPDPVKPCLERALNAPTFNALRDSYIQKYPPSQRVALWKLNVDLRVTCYREHLEASHD